MDYIELHDGSGVQFKSLSEKEYIALSKDAVQGPLAHYMDDYGLDVRVLSNGQIIGRDDKSNYELLRNVDDIRNEWDRPYCNRLKINQ